MSRLRVHDQEITFEKFTFEDGGAYAYEDKINLKLGITMATLLDIIFTNKCHLAGRQITSPDGDLWRKRIQLLKLESTADGK